MHRKLCEIMNRNFLSKNIEFIGYDDLNKKPGFQMAMQKQNGKLTIGEFLLTRLKQIGINHIFGVPGDFNLQLLEQFTDVKGLEFVGTCNELNAAYAADGYARVNGMGAILTTYGVGEVI